MNANLPFPDTLQLPSGLTLKVNLTYPRNSGVEGAKKLAICSHPWSRLGGSMRDPALGALVEPLAKLDYHVLLFNARGVGGSSGWASWTAFQEGKDLEELTSYLVERLGSVQDVALIGYSNGCLSTSLHPVLPSPVRTSHIFISYPLDVRSWLTMFNGRTYQTRLEELVRRPRSRVLFAFGDRDEFSGAASYEKWLKAIQDLTSLDPTVQNESQLEVVRVEGASHFWGGRTLRTLVSAIEDFLR